MRFSQKKLSMKLENPASNKKTLFVPNTTVFISSFCIMVLELVAGRLIARYLGSSLYTWTSVIGVVLAGITLGNFVGGRIADRFAARKALSVLFIGASLSCVITIVMNNFVGQLTLLTFCSWAVRVFIHVALVFLLPSILLGTISPVVAKMALDRGLATGKTVGSVYAWGAAGSIVGTFVAGYYLIAMVGTIQIIWIVAGVLLVMALLYCPGLIAARVWLLIFLPAVTLGAGPWSWAKTTGADLGLRIPTHKNVLYEDESQYCYIAVRQISESPDIRNFTQDYLTHSIVNMDDPADLRYSYEKAYLLAMRQLAKEKSSLRTLTIGGGGYVFPRYIEKFWPNSRVEVAEIDPGVTHAAMRAFGLSPQSSIVTITADGRNYIDELYRRKIAGGEVAPYDFIYEDAINDTTVPFQLTTREFHDKISALLADDGAYLVNIIDVYEKGLFLGALVNTLEKTFPHVYVLFEEKHRHRGMGHITFILVAMKHPLDVAAMMADETQDHSFWCLDSRQLDIYKKSCGSMVLTDNYAPVETLLAPVVQIKGIIPILVGFTDTAAQLAYKGYYQESIAQYQNILNAWPFTAASTYSEMASVQVKAGRLDEAIDAYQKTLQYNDRIGGVYDMSEVHYILGCTLRKKGRTAESLRHLELARQGFQETLSQNPYISDSRLLLAELLLNENQPDQALGHYQKAVELNPQEPWPLLKYTAALERLKKNDQALLILQQNLRKVSPQKDPDSFEKLGQSLKRLQGPKAPSQPLLSPP
jgi:MFS family permease